MDAREDGPPGPAAPPSTSPYDEEAPPIIISSSETVPPADGNSGTGKEKNRGGCMAWLKKAAKKLKHEVLALSYALDDPRTGWMAKFIAFMVIAYALSPLDLIPDFIPILGILDDLLLLPGMIWLAIHLIPKEVMEKARHRARTEPVRLSRNWFVATLVFMLWVASVEWCIYYAINTWGNEELKLYKIHILVIVGLLAVVSFIVWLRSALQKEKRKAAKVEANLKEEAKHGLLESLLTDDATENSTATAEDYSTTTGEEYSVYKGHEDTPTLQVATLRVEDPAPQATEKDTPTLGYSTNNSVERVEDPAHKAAGEATPGAEDPARKAAEPRVGSGETKGPKEFFMGNP
eukprot:gene3953-14031_t